MRKESIETKPMKQERLTFKTPEEFLYEVREVTDLYCPEEETYVFVYNEDGAICVYHVDEEQAKELDKRAKEANDYWASFLGAGGDIYDEPEELAKHCYQFSWVSVGRFSEICGL